MTVRQLMKYLKRFDQNAVVVVPEMIHLLEDEGKHIYNEITELEIKDLEFWNPGRYYFPLKDAPKNWENNSAAGATKCLVIE